MPARAQTGLLVVSALFAGLITGCSDDEPKATPKTPPSSSTAPPPAPVYTETKLKSSLLPPRDIGRNVRDLRPDLQGLSEQSVPACPESPVKVTKPQWSSVRQFADTSSPYAPWYAQYVAAYPDQATAQREFEKIRAAAKKCPKKGHVKPKKVAEKRITPAYDYTWSAREDAFVGWQRVRSLHEKSTEVAGKSNTISFALDYLIRGNALIASIYWERLRPGGSAGSLDKDATEILTKQLQKMG